MISVRSARYLRSTNLFCNIQAFNLVFCGPSWQHWMLGDEVQWKSQCSLDPRCHVSQTPGHDPKIQDLSSRCPTKFASQKTQEDQVLRQVIVVLLYFERISRHPPHTYLTSVFNYDDTLRTCESKSFLILKNQFDKIFRTQGSSSLV